MTRVVRSLSIAFATWAALGAAEEARAEGAVAAVGAEAAGLASVGLPFAFVSVPAMPTEVEIGVYLIGIPNVDPPSEAFPSFDAELFLDLRWNDPRLSFQVAEEGIERKVYQDEAASAELKEIWWPNVQIDNEEGSRKVEARMLAISSDGTVEYTERFAATLHTETDLRRFPFDQQIFEIQIESFNWDERFLRFVPYPERTGFDEGFKMIEWEILGVTPRVTSKKEVRSDVAFSRFILEVHLERQSNYYLWKLVLPLLIIVLFTWSSFWMTGEPAGTKMQRSFIALLTLVAFYQVFSSNLPRISYLTFLDAVSLLTFVSVGLTTLQIVASHRAGQRGDEAMAERFDRIARWAVPSIFVAGFAILWLAYH